MSDSLHVTFIKLVGADAILRSADDREISVPKVTIPKGCAVGAELVLELTPASEVAERHDVVARKLLEDILNGK